MGGIWLSGPAAKPTIAGNAAAGRGSGRATPAKEKLDKGRFDLKKTFPCGHRGKGKFCHRCVQEKKQEAEKELARSKKRKWREAFEKDPLDLRKIQADERLVRKAREIIQGIENGRPIADFQGKRMNHDRRVISIPVGRNYRLLCRDTARGPVVTELLSHEEYNARKPGAVS
jgi:hypothetical protein